MLTEVKSANGTILVPVETRLLNKRKVFLTGEIKQEMACEFVQSMMLLIEENANAPIDVYICSNGGSVEAGMLIVDTLQGIKDTEVNLHGFGAVKSMGAVILACGKPQHRYINEHAEVMIHEPLVESLGGSASSIERTAENLLKVKAMTIELLSNSTGRSKEDVEAAIAYDNHMNAKEAVDFGICDYIQKNIINEGD